MRRLLHDLVPLRCLQVLRAQLLVAARVPALLGQTRRRAHSGRITYFGTIRAGRL